MYKQKAKPIWENNCQPQCLLYHLAYAQVQENHIKDLETAVKTKDEKIKEFQQNVEDLENTVKEQDENMKVQNQEVNELKFKLNEKDKTINEITFKNFETTDEAVPEDLNARYQKAKGLEPALELTSEELNPLQDKVTTREAGVASLCGVEKKHVWKILRKYKLFTLTQLVV